MPHPFHVRRSGQRPTPAGGGWIATAIAILGFGFGASDGGGVLAAEPPDPTIEVAFGGDLLLGEDVNTLAAHRGPGVPLAGVPEIAAAEIAIVNLESVVAPGADAIDSGRVGDYYFLGRPETLGVVEAAGIDLVSTANNHARDFGVASLAAEAGLLSGMGLAHPGTGATRAAACAPAYLRARDLVVAVFAVDTTEPMAATGDGAIGTCFVAPGDERGWRDLLEPAIVDARRTADVVLVMPHFRASFASTPDPIDRAAAQRIIDLGADAVIASGAHELQGIEVRDGRPIVHNAGSLLFNFPEPDDSALFLLTVGPSGIEQIRTVPLVLERSVTRHATSTDAERILGAIDARSRELGTAIADGRVELAPKPRDAPPMAPANLATLDPGPAPGPVLEPPAACAVAAVPADAAIAPTRIGPLTMVGARVDRDRLAGPALIWLETFWSVETAIQTDLLIRGGASPERGTSWVAAHEPCEWGWPTSRWQPGVIYRDRVALRPPADVRRLAGVPALLTMTGYGPLRIDVGVLDGDRSLGDSGPVATVTLDPAPTTVLALAGAATTAAIGAVVALAWYRRRARRDRA